MATAITTTSTSAGIEYTGMPRPHEPGGEYDPEGTGQGWNWKDYLHPEDVERTQVVWQRSLATGQPYHVEYRFKRQDSVFRWFIGRALPLHDESGAISRWFGTCTDVDDQKKLEEEREQLLNSERVARSEAERAARVKDEFVATLSHELRTPLNAIMGWTSVLKRDRSVNAVDKGLEVIDRNARLQAQMIEDLLDINRILSGKIRLEVQHVDLADVDRSRADVGRTHRRGQRRAGDQDAGIGGAGQRRSCHGCSR